MSKMRRPIGAWMLGSFVFIGCNKGAMSQDTERRSAEAGGIKYSIEVPKTFKHEDGSWSSGERDGISFTITKVAMPASVEDAKNAAVVVGKLVKAEQTGDGFLVIEDGELMGSPYSYVSVFKGTAETAVKCKGAYQTDKDAEAERTWLAKVCSSVKVE